MVSDIIIGLVGAVSTIICSAATFFFTKKKYNAEVDHQLIENLKQSLDFYIKLSEDNSRKLEEYRKENEALRAKQLELQTQVSSLMNSICYKEACRERVTSELKVQKERKINGTKSTKKVEKE